MDSPPRLDDPNFEKLTEHIQELLEQVEALPYPKVQTDTYELLNCMDLLHREALMRLIEIIELNAPQLKLEMANDFAIQTLMMLYNFVPDEPPPVVTPVSSDLVNSGLANSTYIPLDQIEITPAIQMPVWIPGGSVVDLPAGSMRGQIFEDARVLLCHVEGQIFALQNACLDSVLPLDRGELHGHELSCPWHGCRYDVRSGEILNGSGLRLETFPVKVEGKRFLVGFNMPPHMREQTVS